MLSSSIVIGVSSVITSSLENAEELGEEVKQEMWERHKYSWKL
jgi:hypothetical protein